MLNSLNFKIHKIFVLSLLLLLSSSCSDPDYYLADGSSGSLDDFKGKWLVVNYWADWCPPCIKEMPELTNFYNDNISDVTVLAFNFDELEGEELEEQIVRFKVDIPSILTNPGLIFGWESPETLPTTFIIDKEGVVRETLLGPQTQEGLEALIKKYTES
jgi:thiol-disulfide isomerase/thioredoxin|tara:strand:+ start:11 stop:487 length:477 start_codon:yes stop_codon:yes gene_type:complete